MKVGEMEKYLQLIEGKKICLYRNAKKLRINSVKKENVYILMNTSKT